MILWQQSYGLPHLRSTIISLSPMLVALIAGHLPEISRLKELITKLKEAIQGSRGKMHLVVQIHNNLLCNQGWL